MQEALLDIHTPNGCHDLDGIAGLSERRTETDQFGMPDTKHDVSASYRLRASEDGIGGHLRESFVDRVLVGLTASKREGIVRAGVPVNRLHEDQTTGGAPAVGRGRDVELATVDVPRPLVTNTLERPSGVVEFSDEGRQVGARGLRRFASRECFERGHVLTHRLWKELPSRH